jgi:hypothetical protein
MCAALGGSRYWTDLAGKDAFSQNGRPVSLMAERSARVALINDLVASSGVRIQDLAGSSYVVVNAAGESRNAYSLGELWQAVEEVSHRPFDPLDLAEGITGRGA